MCPIRPWQGVPAEGAQWPLGTERQGGCGKQQSDIWAGAGSEKSALCSAPQHHSLHPAETWKAELSISKLRWRAWSQIGPRKWNSNPARGRWLQAPPNTHTHTHTVGRQHSLFLAVSHDLPGGVGREVWQIHSDLPLALLKLRRPQFIIEKILSLLCPYPLPRADLAPWLRPLLAPGC